MIAILDFGSQYTHLIVRRIRSLGVSSQIFPSDVSPQTLRKRNIQGIILSGGPGSVNDENAPSFNQDLFQMGIPILGICFGHQLLAKLQGGSVKLGKVKEYGEETIILQDRSDLFFGLGKKETVWFSHGDEVMKLPAGFKVTASTANTKVASYENPGKKMYGIQFHPEVVHTPKGMKILENFLFKICGSSKDWQIGDLRTNIIKKLKETIGSKKVLIGVSGGVDSLVAAKLLNEAIKNNLYCVFIDTGFMRKDEASQVRSIFFKERFKNFISVDAKRGFIEGLKGIIDPEEKRKVFAKVYFRVFERTVKNLKLEEGIEFLAQGTIYPDRIEAAKVSSVASLIKSHHNVTLPSKLKFRLIEPLGDLYKDEVRALGESLGLSAEALDRHPFPGPGLLIRILGEVTDERLEILREADAIFIQELKSSGEYKKVWQALVALLPLKSVGVMGDERTYQYLIALRAVTSADAMTADWARLPDQLLNKVSKRIINEVGGVNRVLYDITQKPPATIEYE